MPRTLHLPAVLLALCLPIPAQDPKPAIPEDKDPRTTASGLVISILVPGPEGPRPKPGDTVRVHYTGWLQDGTVFDDSRRRGEPARFVLGGVIEGWNEALATMTPGTRAKLSIPPSLGYGSRRQGIIPPDSTLIFDVELLGVEPGDPLPVFQRLDPHQAKTTASGLRYQVLEAGEGEPAAAGEVVVISYAYWSEAGKLVGCSRLQGDVVKGQASQIALPFLREAAGLMPPRARWRLEVPPALAFGERGHPQLGKDALTIWELVLERVLRPLPLPGFQLPPEDALQRRPSGLQFEVIREGTGKKPRLGQAVTVHYAGWLPDGKAFDSSYKRGEPSTFRLGQVIEGWNEGLQLVGVGGIIRLVIPPHLAYGERGAGADIPPNATLVFHIELIEVRE
jgi:FKBP-type peptidyl-prolyl cis-trans isomerase